MKKIFSLCVAVFSFALAPVFGLAGIASAQTVPVVQAAQAGNANTGNAGNCGVSAADFAALSAIQNNPNLSVADELNQELALRKQLLARTLACAIKDANGLKIKIVAAQANWSETDIPPLLNDKIDETLNFYNIESAKLGDAGIRATEIIAQEILAWRAANYFPLASNVNNFALYAKNQGLFQTAEARLAKTSRIVSLIESTAPNGDLQTMLNDVRSSLSDAEIENTAAGNALRTLLTPDATYALIEQSLQSLADTYQKFSVLNDSIQKLLSASS